VTNNEVSLLNFDRVILSIVGILALGLLLRIAIGPTIWDRLLVFSVFSGKAIVFSVLIGFIIDSDFMVDVGLIYGMLGFVGTIMIARFIERRGDI